VDNNAIGNLTLTETELLACQPVTGEGGRVVRAFCPFHGSNHQRSLRITVATGRFACFACGAWGYIEEHKQAWIAQQRRVKMGLQCGRRGHDWGQKSRRGLPLRPTWGHRQPSAPTPAHPDLTRQLVQFQEALPSSPGEQYLRQRGIPLEVAERYGVGYAASGTWLHSTRDWKWGRLVVPHTTPDGRLVNLYGRAVGSDKPVPKPLRHDHLPGEKGYFNARALQNGKGPLFVCEGAFDALSLLAAGYARVVAIFGVDGWHWEWARNVPDLVLAFDADPVGQWRGRECARQARLRGKQVTLVAPQGYGGHKDVNEAWVAGTLILSNEPTGWELWAERAAIMEVDGGLRRDEAERQAFARLAHR
jgi:DNA primase